MEPALFFLLFHLIINYLENEMVTPFLFVPFNSTHHLIYKNSFLGGGVGLG